MSWEAALGGTAGGVLGIIGSAIQGAEARNAAKKAYSRSVHSYQNRYQWQMDDMRAAGLNPILAYKQSPPGGPVAQAAQIAPWGENLAGGFSKGASAGAAATQAREKRKQTPSVIDVNAALADRARAEANAVGMTGPANAAKAAAEAREANNRARITGVEADFAEDHPNWWQLKTLLTGGLGTIGAAVGGGALGRFSKTGRKHANPSGKIKRLRRKDRTSFYSDGRSNPRRYYTNHDNQDW